MRRVGAFLVGVLGLVSVASAGNIDGKIMGWSGKSLSRPAVVWLEGVQMSVSGRADPLCPPQRPSTWGTTRKGSSRR
jgi:hypothetical protein